MARRVRQPVAVAASVVAVLVAAACAGALVWSARTAMAADRDIRHATDVLISYQALQDAVADQAYAEAGFRRAPSPATRARIDEAAASVQVAVDDARDVGDPADRATLSYVLILNRRYVAEIRRTIDQEVPPGADDRVAGPSLQAMDSLLDATVSRYVDDRHEVLQRQRRVLDRLNWLLPIVVAGGAATLALCWAALLRAHRRLAVRAEDSERRAGRDPLTGLANRDVLTAELLAAMGGDEPSCAVLLLDLDHFKPVNDTFGHVAGDDVLVAVALALRSAARGTDLVARFGGDEFAVVVTPAHRADVVAERIQQALAHVPTPDGSPVRASIGVAAAGAGCATPALLLAAADDALYRAKRAGRGRTSFAVGECARPDDATPRMFTT